MARVKIRNFQGGQWITGGREYSPTDAEGGPITLRHADGMNPLMTPSLRSRPGSSLVLGGAVAHSLVRFNGIRFAGIGNAFVRLDSGAVVQGGLSGKPLSFAKMPAQAGGPDYLFVADGSSPFKVDLKGNVSNWGIQPPLDGMQASVGAQDSVLIDDFESNPTAAWTNASPPPNAQISPFHATLANETTIVQSGNGSLKITPSAGPWTISKYLGSPLNLGTYADAVISLPTDYISIWFNCKHPTTTTWLEVQFDVNDSTFKKDYYSAVIQVVPTTQNKHAADAVVVLTAPADAWFNVALAKNQFLRTGTNLNLDWLQVKAIRISGGYLPPDSNPSQSAPVYVDNFTMFGGYPLGIGTTAITGGSIFQYQVTFGNDVTGSDSNPNDDPLVVANVAEQPVHLYNIPTSPDGQVTNRKLWRTLQDQSGALFFLDKIPDNSTTTYDDLSASVPMRLITTPWVKSAAYPGGAYVDEGNGYYAHTVAGGTTGAVSPNWGIPTTAWGPLKLIDIAGEIVLPIATHTSNHSAFRAQNAGTTGPTEPNWKLAAAVSQTIVDGSVTWQNIGQLNTADNTVVWQTFGLNAVPVLGNQQVALDNAPPPAKTLRIAGPYQDMMFSMESDLPDHVNYSPPGRPESFSGFISITEPDDPIQNLVIYNGNLYAFTQQRPFFIRVVGTTVQPGITIVLLDFNPIEGAPGTTFPFSIVVANQYIIYQAMEGLMKFDGATAVEFGMDALGPIFRGEFTENLGTMSIRSACYHDGEYICTDQVRQTLAINTYNGRWRSLGLSTNCLYTELDTTSLLASLISSNNIVLLEQPGTLTDAGTPIRIDWQTASIRLAVSQQVIIQRMYLDISTNGAQILPQIILDGNVIPLPPFIGNGRKSPPYEWTLGLSGQLLALELTGNVANGIIELFGVEWDISAGTKAPTP